MGTSTAREAWRLIGELVFSGEMTERMVRASAEAGVSPGHLKSMFHLEPGNGVPMRNLAEHWRCDASYVTSVADALEERGFARRLPHPSDRRIKMIALTEEGVAARERAYELLFEPPASLSALTPAELRQLRDLLRKIAEADPTLDRAHSSVFGGRHARSREHVGVQPPVGVRAYHDELDAADEPRPNSELSIT